MCAVSLYLENEPCGVFDQELDAAFPSYERGNLRVRGLTRGSAKELPRNLQGKQILLLAPVVSRSVVVWWNYVPGVAFAYLGIFRSIFLAVMLLLRQ